MRFAGERPNDPEALGRVVQREPDDEDQGQAELSPSRGLADCKALREIVEADPERDEEGEALSGPQSCDGAGVELAYVRRARTETDRCACAPREPEVVVHKAHQSDRQRHRKDSREPAEVEPRSATLRLRERRLDRLDTLCEDVPKKEKEDAGRARVQERSHPSRCAAHASEGKSEEHGEPRDRA